METVEKPVQVYDAKSARAEALRIFDKTFPDTRKGNRRYIVYTGISEYVKDLSAAEIVAFCELVKLAESK